MTLTTTRELIDPMDTFSLGVCYYPEQWPRERWEMYAQRMNDLGLSYARIGEFAWSRIEPEPECWDWDWLDDAVTTLSRAGLKVVLCTPTAAPPAWLVHHHPEILPVDREGRVRHHGSRRHYDFSSAVYREHSQRVTRALATRYGQHAAVVGWQTDNEFGDHIGARSYSPVAAAAFRAWLRERYTSIDALNEAWGAVFWNQLYVDWEHIGLPNLTFAEPNPSHALDFSRFTSDQVKGFQEEQVAILRELSPGRWVTHNFMRLESSFDHYQVSDCLDFVSWDNYPTGGIAYSNLSDDMKLAYARTGHPDLISINHDLYRGMKAGNSFWVMEQQPGQINWAPSNPLPAPGAVALWTMQAWAHGASVVSYFRWRAATMAQEVMHSALLRHDDTLDRGGEEIAALDLSGLRNTEGPASVVVLHDYDSLWVQDEQPHATGAGYWDQMMLFYTVLRRLGVDVDIRHADSDLGSYRLVVVPALQIIDESRARRFEQIAGSAHMIFGPRTGYRTPTGRVQEDGQPGPLRALLGCRLLNFDGMPPGLTVRAGVHVVHTWAESYRVTTGEVLARYTSGPLSGQAAVVGNGNVTTVGAWCESLLDDIIRGLLARNEIPIIELPEGVRVTRRGSAIVWQNFNEHPVTLDNGVELPPVSFLVEREAETV
jgi:beta-galactosidase